MAKYAPRTATFEERFWAKADVRGPDQCWPWVARRDGDGYGSVQKDGRKQRAARVAYEMSKGRFQNQNTKKTHCLRGHALEGENLRLRADRPRTRECRACSKARAA
jgi:hypothetical protein